MVTKDPLQQLRGLDRASPHFHEHLNNILRGKEYRDVLPELQSEDLTWLIEYLDNTLVDVSDGAGIPFQESLHELKKICGREGVLPESCTLSESLLECVSEGTFDGSKVRIRRVKMHPGGDPRKVMEVAVMAKHIAHPNIVPLLGAIADPLELISDWMPGGDLTTYITNHSDADRHSLLSDVAEGLRYLHSCNIIHGDLKASNILVDATGHARVTDFGLAVVIQDLSSIRNVSAEGSRNARWIAPEILDDRGSYSKEADVFSFAGVMIEVFTGAAPFGDKLSCEAVLAITGGERPPRPAHPTLTDDLWTLIQDCWHHEACMRPHALQISRSLGGAPAWKRLVDGPTPDERISLIMDIFSDRHETEMVKRLCGEDAQSFVDVVYEMLDALAPRLQSKCLGVLREMCDRQALLPKSIKIPLCCDLSGIPLDRGGYADAWKGQHQDFPVMVKVLRLKLYSTSDFEMVTSRFCKEVVIWRTLRHPNVVPLLGVTIDNFFAVTSEWMENGNINEFIRANRNVDRFELLKDVTRGLTYLHDREIVHGDLKGANVLIDQDGHARLADSGLLTFVSGRANLIASSSAANAGAVRWMSPELLHPELFDLDDSQPTRESDCYSLGMMVLEVLSGQAPFACYKVSTITRKVTEGEHPERPEEARFTDDLWKTLEQCWSYQPRDRPAVEAVLECLERGSVPQKSGGPGSNRDVVPSVSVVTATQKPSAFIYLREIVNWDGKFQDIGKVLTAAFEAEDYPHCVKNLQAVKIDPLSYINCLDRIIDTIPTNSDLWKRCIRFLTGACGLYGILPASHEITFTLTEPRGRPISSCSFFTHWKLTNKTDRNQVFTVKSFCAYTNSNAENIKKKYCGEVIVLKRMNHPNFLPIEGVAPQISKLSLVSKWMVNGDVPQYLAGHPEVNRLGLIIGVTRGLGYLHENGIVHGDLKGQKVLIDAEGNPRLYGFQYCSFNPGPIKYSFSRERHHHAPERIRSGGTGTEKSDVYSLSMFIVELVTREIPFPGFDDSIVLSMVFEGRRPQKPKNFGALKISPGVWEVAERCWHQEANQRPEVKVILQDLEGIANL